jgi:hypothetical protein
MERPTPMKTEQAINGLYPDDDDDVEYALLLIAKYFNFHTIFLL